ncbi:MAG: hypothetical protein ACK415_09125 [Thermodesulfovibrionales bacterium]
MKRTKKMRLGDVVGWKRVMAYIEYLKMTKNADEMDRFCEKNFKKIRKERIHGKAGI